MQAWYVQISQLWLLLPSNTPVVTAFLTSDTHHVTTYTLVTLPPYHLHTHHITPFFLFLFLLLLLLLLLFLLLLLQTGYSKLCLFHDGFRKSSNILHWTVHQPITNLVVNKEVFCEWWHDSKHYLFQCDHTKQMSSRECTQTGWALKTSISLERKMMCVFDEISDHFSTGHTHCYMLYFHLSLPCVPTISKGVSDL